MPAPTFDLQTVIVGPNESQTTEADLEAGINAALLAVDNRAVAGLNAGTIAPLIMGGTANAMTGSMPPSLADTSIYNGRPVRFIPPGGNTAPPTLEIGGTVFSVRDMHGRELPAGALTNRRYVGMVNSIGPTPPAQIWLIAPIQMADIPGLFEGATLQRGPVAAGGNLNLLTQPGVYFLEASGGYVGMPPEFNPGSAAWLEVVNYGGENGQGSGRFVLQTLTSMATVLPGGPGHVYRPTFQRRHDSLTPDAPSNISAWTPIHAITPLAGKRVVCLGDSITQGGGGWDWPAMLAGLTGATVVNGGFGGCRMGQHSLPLFDPFSMYRVSERIRYGDWSVLTAAADALYVGTGDDRRPAAARLAAVDWSQVSHIVIGYGTNDFGGDVPLGSDGDMTGATFKGAINLAVRNILTAYPSIQILIQTPLWRSRVYVSGDDSNVTPNGLGLYLRDYAQAIRDRAAAYQLPVCDLHASAGINPLNAAAMMPDGLHPWSTAGVERVATIVAGSLLSASGGGGGGVELGAVVATPAEIRSGSGNGVVTPAGLAAAAAPVSLGATVSGDVLLDPLNPATGGINMVAWVAGPTVFRSPANLPALSGTLRVRMLAAVEVHFDRSILRDEDMPLLTPDPRCWLDTVYGWDVIDGHLRLWTHMPVKALVDAPTLNAFGAAWDPGAGLGLVTDGSGAVASVGDPVRYLPPAVQNRAYLNAAGGTSTVGVTDMVLDTAAADGAPPVLIERDGRQALMGNAGGTGLEATMAGFGSLGLPNPAASPNAMPFYTRLTMMQMLYLPVGMGGGCPMSAYRADTAQTAQMGLMLNAAGLAWGYGRFSAGAVPQVSSAAAVAGNTAVHAAEMDAELGRWLLVALQIRITGTIETVEDTAPPGTTQRGAGATWEMWVDDGVGEFGAHAITTFSSYRGTNGFRPNRFRLFALGNNGSAVSPIGAASGRVLATVDDTLVPGSPAWRAWGRWVGGL